MKANVSLCIIVKNEPLLEQCLLSIKDYVSEIVIVDTGSTDNTPEVARKYADIFEIYTECNDPETGLIEDFSKARQRAFDLATKPWVMWCDADDVIIGAESLLPLTKNFEIQLNNQYESVAYLFPYEYSFDANGNCTCRHYRERLFFGKENVKWVNPVHEVAIPVENKNILLERKDNVTFIHKRTSVHESGRNLRILRKYFETHTAEQDPRQVYYLGLECAANGLIDEAIQNFSTYIDLSGWDDERVMACLKLVDIYQAQSRYEDGLKWALKALSIQENWFESHFAVSKMYYFLALKGGANSFRNWERCTHFGNLALRTPATQTVLFVNPIDRDLEIYRYLNVAYNSLGQVDSALHYCNLGLDKNPGDPNLLANKSLYESFLARKRIVESLEVLHKNNAITNHVARNVTSLINNQPINNLLAPSLNPHEPFVPAAIGSSSTEWTIPESYDFNGYPIRLTNEQLQATVIMLWKQYILHDEILLAEEFLKNAPYMARHSVATEKAIKATKAMTSWIRDPDLAQKHNAPEVVDIEIGMPLPYALNGQQGSRFDAIVNYLDPTSEENPVSILDFGCFDGAFTNRYARLGYKVIGIDLVRSSIALANKKAQEFNTGAIHMECYFQDVENKLPHHSMDYATSTESYEHLLDPVNDMLLPAKKILKSTGKFLLSCPHGAWFRGNYFSWAHPWLWGQTEESHWLSEHPRGHLIAPDVWTLANDFRKAGYWVKNSFVMLSDFPDCPGQGNVFSEAHVQAPEGYPDKDIIFYLGDGLEEWTPNTVKKNGIGGSETMALEMAKRLALQGNRVRVFASCGRWGEGIYDGVEYYQSEKFENLHCDILIISRKADMIDEKYKVKAKLKLLWVHDVCAVSATNSYLLKYDRILALSEWHKQNLIAVHNLHPDHIIVTRNGIDLSRFAEKLKRNPYKVVNSSSPDRSWPILLECWSSIKQQVPDAELHLFYGFKNWERFAQNDPAQLALINAIKEKIEEFKPIGVVFHDRVNQEKLAEEYLTASVCAHPTWFTETSGITFMEAQAAGLRIVSSALAALNETVGDRGVLLEGSWTSDEYKRAFIDAVVFALKKKVQTDRIAIQDYARQHFGLDELANDWTQMFASLLAEKSTNPVIPYQSTEAYR